MKATIMGYTLMATPEQHDDAYRREMFEKQAVEAFEHRYGFPPTSGPIWLREEASVWTSPDTGKVYELPERWRVVVEGARP